jgi:hypothetical protein
MKKITNLQEWLDYVNEGDYSDVHICDTCAIDPEDGASMIISVYDLTEIIDGADQECNHDLSKEDLNRRVRIQLTENDDYYGLGLVELDNEET